MVSAVEMEGSRNCARPEEAAIAEVDEGDSATVAAAAAAVRMNLLRNWWRIGFAVAATVEWLMQLLMTMMMMMHRPPLLEL
jgi:hypothetical protein